MKIMIITVNYHIIYFTSKETSSHPLNKNTILWVNRFGEEANTLANSIITAQEIPSSEPP